MGDRITISFKVSAVVEQGYQHIVTNRKWWGSFNPIGEAEFGLIRVEVEPLVE